MKLKIVPQLTSSLITHQPFLPRPVHAMAPVAPISTDMLEVIGELKMVTENLVLLMGATLCWSTRLHVLYFVEPPRREQREKLVPVRVPFEIRGGTNAMEPDRFAQLHARMHSQ